MINNLKISIRLAKVEDLPRVLFITKLAYKVPYKSGMLITKPHESKDIKNRFINKEFFIVVAECGGKIIGSVRYRLENNNLYFYQLSVLKTYRKIGVGLLLIKRIEKIAKEKKCKKITLDFALEKGLEDYYKKFGFSRINKVKKHFGYHEVSMSKMIK